VPNDLAGFIPSRVSSLSEPGPRWVGRKRRYREALLLIGTTCSNYVGGRTTCVTAGRLPDADFTADRWCDQCIAREGLNG
jgi:hypothetical protein